MCAAIQARDQCEGEAAGAGGGRGAAKGGRVHQLLFFIHYPARQVGNTDDDCGQLYKVLESTNVFIIYMDLYFLFL